MKKKKQLTGQKVVLIAYTCKRWLLFMRSSCYRALTGKMLVFWINGCLQEVVAHEVLTLYLFVCQNYSPVKPCLT